MALERERLELDKKRHRDEVRLGWAKAVATGLVAIVASIAVPWAIANQNVELERLKLNAASVEHVRTVLQSDLEPDSRRRIYEYLVTAFRGTPLHDWALTGLTKSQTDLADAKRELEETRAKMAGVKQDFEDATTRVQDLEAALEASNDEQKKVALEEELAVARLKASEESKRLSAVSARNTSPMDLNATALKLWNDGQHSEARRLLGEACDRDYWQACFNLASAWHRGKVQDLALAGDLYKRACGRGHPRSCTDMGDLKSQEGLAGEAISFYEQGCSLGDQRGCDELVSRGRKPPKEPPSPQPTLLP